MMSNGAQTDELCAEVGDGLTGRRRRIVGVFEPPLLQQRSDTPSDANVVKLLQPGSFGDPLTEVLRNGARALLGALYPTGSDGHFCRATNRTGAIRPVCHLVRGSSTNNGLSARKELAQELNYSGDM